MNIRKANIERKTKETAVSLQINLDKSKPIDIKTSIGLLDHMLALFAYHGNISLKLKASGDTQVDNHHLVEDIGITLGMALDRALGKRVAINRYGSFLIPMDEALSYVSIDISGRPFLDYNVKFKTINPEFDYNLLEDFFYSLAINSKITLHISLKRGRSNHHIAESIFKGFGRSFAQAISKDNKKKGIPSTKGRI